MFVSSKLCKKNRWGLLVGRGDCRFPISCVGGVVLKREGGNERDKNVCGRARVLTGWWLSTSANA